MELPLVSLPQHPLGSIDVRIATPEDRHFIDALQRKHVNNTGFVPFTAIEDHLNRQSYHLLSINGQPTGYAMHAGGTRKPLRLIQVALSEDAWRNGLGTVLIQLALQRAENALKTGMTATVREGLTMNQVVTATGATPTRRDTTPPARGLDRIHYAWSGIATPTHDPHQLRHRTLDERFPNHLYGTDDDERPGTY